MSPRRERGPHARGPRQDLAAASRSIEPKGTATVPTVDRNGVLLTDPELADVLARREHEREVA